MVWTHGKNKGLFGVKNSKIRCERCEVKERPQTGWMDGVKRALNERGMCVCGARKDNYVIEVNEEQW